MDHAVLTELAIVMAVSVAAAALLRRVHVPPVVGFIVAGIVIGPGGIALIDDRAQIEIVAEVGVMLLLFTIGLKLKIGDLWRLRGAVFGVGSAQVLTTGSLVFLLATALGRSHAEAVVWGAMAALSSTALVLWLLEGTGDIGTGYGRTMMSVLLLQDLAVVPIMLALPLLAGSAASVAEVSWFLFRAASVILLTVTAARMLFPWITARIVATGSRELFTLTTVLGAVGTALVFGHFGLSMALGAFLAGIVVSESEYVGRMIDDVTPLRDVFNSLFFVSLGMLVNPHLWLDRPVLTIGGVLIMVALKATTATIAAWPLLRSWTAALAVGLGLAQIGEFSVIVATEAGRVGILGVDALDLFLAIAVPTMILTPFFMKLSTHLGRLRETVAGGELAPVELDDHTIIVGYGVNGRNVERALRLLEVPHIVIDLNPYTVSEIRQRNGLAVEGDARHREVLQAVGMERARGLVAAIPDATSTREVVEAARALNPEARILARTRFLRDVQCLENAGANHVIPEEFETSLELTGRVLALYGAPPHVVEREKTVLRNEGYGLLRGDSESLAAHPSLESLCSLQGISRLRVEAGSTASGRSIGELDIRKRTGASVLAISRGGEASTNPGPEQQLEAGDEVLVYASAPAVEKLSALVGTSSAVATGSQPVSSWPRE